MRQPTDSELREMLQREVDSLHVPKGLNERVRTVIEERRSAEEADRASSGGIETLAPAIPRKSKRTWFFAAAACLVAVIIGFTGVWWATTPTAFVTIEVNPSIELGVSRFDRVVSAQAINKDAEPVLEGVDIIGLPFGEALDRLTSSQAFSAYTTADQTIEVDIACNNAQQAAALQAAGNHCLDGLSAHGSCHVVDDATWQAAQEAGMGIARYQASVELMALDPSVSLGECASMTLREIRDRIAALGGSIGSETDGGRHGEGGHHAGANAQGGGHGHGGTGAADSAASDQGYGNGAEAGMAANGSGNHRGQRARNQD